MTNVAPLKTNVPALQMSEEELFEVLRNSLYPGAADSSIRLVVGYCRASGLDPMLKPVHIVPMYVKEAGKQNGAMRDVIMPGIGLYRIQAARGGQYAGVSEPEFGPDVTETLAGVNITYPSWCKVIVRRQLANGQIAEFAAVERWKENYAAAGRDTAAPNAMWRKRPYGQLAKCSEAQALRKAFPEIGAAPTAEEMEGKVFEEARDVSPSSGRHEQEVPELESYPDDKFKANLETWRKTILQGKSSPDHIISKVSTKYALTPDQIEAIHGLAPIDVQPEPVAQ